MNRWLLVLALTFVSVAVFAGALGDPVPPVVKHIEIAGTLVIDQGELILKSNGHQYLLSLDSSETGVSVLKSGMALIVKGTVTIVDDADGKSRTLRPDEIIVRGHTYRFEDPPAP